MHNSYYLITAEMGFLGLIGSLRRLPRSSRSVSGRSAKFPRRKSVNSSRLAATMILVSVHINFECVHRLRVSTTSWQSQARFWSGLPRAHYSRRTDSAGRNSVRSGVIRQLTVIREETAFSDEPPSKAARWIDIAAAPVQLVSKRIPLLDGWRATSILLVLGSHLLPLGPKVLGLNEAAGAMGMALFFTLSGFLITQFLAAGMPIGISSLEAVGKDSSLVVAADDHPAPVAPMPTPSRSARNSCLSPTCRP